MAGGGEGQLQILIFWPACPFSADLLVYPSGMSFGETYKHETLQSRRDRSRRSMFWARILGILLMLTIGAILRSEPQLRQDLMNAGINGILKLTKRDQPQFANAPLPTNTKGNGGIKINRPVTEAPNGSALAAQAARRVAARKVGD
ncbi:hypothetical protein PM02_10855 [Sulfitobacter mediterraneus]|uniref:Uncharacterized protein n=2 Tax=Sulfitobacter mediterraneus TaxID=83219 RepID=A0A061SUR4_9RHOB|nr:hypothetical protein PM02_10855 [Sulfitobacter mediterraneus]